MPIVIDGTYLRSDGAMVIYESLIDSITAKHKTNGDVLFLSDLAIDLPVYLLSLSQKRFQFRSYFHLFFWHTFKLKKYLEKKDCTHLYAVGGYYIGRFIPFSMFLQNLLPFDKAIIKHYPLKLHLKYLMLYLFYRRSIKRASEVFLFTRHSMGYVQQAEENAISKVKYAPFEISLERGKADGVQEKKKQVEVVFFYPANITYYKNHKRLVEVFAQLSKKGYSVTLLLAGRIIGKEAEALLSAILRIDGAEKFLRYLGFLDRGEMRNYYEHADYVIYPSLIESIGVPIYEAMMLKKEILCSNHITLATEVFVREEDDGTLRGRYCVQAGKEERNGGYQRITFFDPEDEIAMQECIENVLAVRHGKA